MTKKDYLSDLVKDKKEQIAYNNREMKLIGSAVFFERWNQHLYWEIEALEMLINSEL